jgi:hypothetical protein
VLLLGGGRLRGVVVRMEHCYKPREDKGWMRGAAGWLVEQKGKLNTCRL